MERLELPRRSGESPLVSSPNPHEQLTQIAPVYLQDRLVTWSASLPGVAVGASFVAPAGSRALHLSPTMATGPLEAFFAGTEFAHVHPSYDGSAHIHLPKTTMQPAIDAGWGVLHEPSGALLLYGPRDETEFEVACALIRVSYHYALGNTSA